MAKSSVGRRKVGSDVLKGIRARLFQWKERKQYKSVPEFSERVGIPESTLKGWLAPKKKAKAPDLASLIQLADREHLSLDWLIFGEGPELRGATRPLTALGSELRAMLARACATGYLEKYAGEIFLMLPSAEQLLSEVTKIAREWIDRDLLVRSRLLHRADVEYYKKYVFQDRADDLDETILDGPPSPGSPDFLKGMFKDDEQVTDIEREITRDSVRELLEHHRDGGELAIPRAKLSLMLGILADEKKLNQLSND